MTLGLRFDPVKSYNFLISFVDSSSTLATASVPVESVLAAGFSEASGLDMSLEIEEYKEGGRNDMVHKFPSRITWGNLRFKRGMALSDDLWDWLYGFAEGRGRRRDGLVTLQDDLHLPVRMWQFRRGIPIKWSGPTLNGAQSEVALEELEIAHEGLTLVSGGLLGIGEAVGVVRDIVGF